MALPSKGPQRTLKARAVAWLARREYSRSELREKLTATGASVGEADALVEELVQLGYLSDARFAQSVVRRRSGTHSKRAIAGALKAKGVGAEETADALAEHSLDDNDALLALWRRRFGRAPADDRDKARQVRYLQSRGFDLSAILKLLRHPPTS